MKDPNHLLGTSLPAGDSQSDSMLDRSIHSCIMDCPGLQLVPDRCGIFLFCMGGYGIYRTILAARAPLAPKDML